MKKIKKRDLISFGCVFCSSLIMAATTKTFVRPAHLLSGGFMGIALLVDMIADLFGKSIPTAFTLVALNVPVALICAKKISKRFVFFSLLQVFLTSFLLQIIPNYPLFDEQVLNVVFGGYIWGMSIVLALKAAGMNPGTDVKVIAIDGQAEAVEAIIAGEMNCIATCNPRFGPVAFDTMEKYLNEEKLEHIINNEEYIIDSTNAEEKLPDAF